MGYSFIIAGRNRSKLGLFPLATQVVMGTDTEKKTVIKACSGETQPKSNQLTYQSVHEKVKMKQILSDQ